MLLLPGDRRRELGAAGRRHVASHYSLPAVAARYRQLYLRLGPATQHASARLAEG